MEFPYQDMLELPHHVSQRHPPMSLRDRAAQFAPFSALTGYEALLKEVARTVEPRRELAEASQELLNAQLQLLMGHLAERPIVQIEHFLPDARKNGGTYRHTTGRLVQVLPDEGQLVLSDGNTIALADIAALKSDVLDELDFTG